MRVVFMGTPDFSVPTLQALIDSRYDVVGVFTQPDRPKGRGGKVQMSPVKELALKYDIPVFQPLKMRLDGLEPLKELAPDICVTAAFGQILSQEVLDVPPMGTVNVHASLLPRHRGAAPIQWSILSGDKVAGVTTMFSDRGIDTGDMLLKAETEIGPLETAGELTVRLSELGAQLLIDTLKRYPEGDLKPTAQDEAASSYQPMLNKDMARIDWSKSANEIACLVRGMNPWPCAYTENENGRLKIYLAQACEAKGAAEPGSVTVSSAKEGLCIACGDGWLEILEMQAPNAKRMSAKAYLQGKKIEPGTKFN